MALVALAVQPAARLVLLVAPALRRVDEDHRVVVATLWSTALTPATAYVTRIVAPRDAPRTADVLSVPAAA